MASIGKNDTDLGISAAAPSIVSLFPSLYRRNDHLRHAAHLSLRLAEDACVVVARCVREPSGLVLNAVSVMDYKNLLRGPFLDLEVLLTVELVVTHASRLSRCGRAGVIGLGFINF